jgi:hypothetical protein
MLARCACRLRPHTPFLRQWTPARRTAATATRSGAPPTVEHDFDGAPVLRVVQRRADERAQLLSEVCLHFHPRVMPG